jgi:hypothetical protein
MRCFHLELLMGHGYERRHRWNIIAFSEANRNAYEMLVENRNAEPYLGDV